MRPERGLGAAARNARHCYSAPRALAVTDSLRESRCATRPSTSASSAPNSLKPWHEQEHDQAGATATAAAAMTTRAQVERLGEHLRKLRLLKSGERMEALLQHAAANELPYVATRTSAPGVVVFVDRIIATAILDPLLHHTVTMNIRGNSYLLNDKLKAGLVRPSADIASQPGGET